MSPSSHTSVPTFLPSPHISFQMSGTKLDPPVHEYPVSVTQELLHPSLLLKLPSSQISRPTFKPSPQISDHTSGVDNVPPVHEYPLSTVQ